VVFVRRALRIVEGRYPPAAVTHSAKDADG
jgi:hypothetical protein